MKKELKGIEEKGVNMEDFEFIVSPEELRKNQKRVQLKKVYKLKKWVRVAGTILLTISCVVMLYLAFRVTPEDKEALNYCMEQGYSKTICEKGLFGY